MTPGVPQPDGELQIEAGQEGDTYIVRLVGQLDLDGCESVEAALRQGEDTRAERILVDLDQLSFIDSSGLQLLLRAARRAGEDGNRLRITRGSGHVAELFRLTSMDQVLPLI